MLWGEVHVFQGRTFVTRGRFTTGIAVGDEGLGEAILRLYALDPGSYRDGGVSWRAFCEDVAGVPVRRYHPEKTARVFFHDGRWQAVVDPSGPEETMSAGPGADVAPELGAMVRRVLDATEPCWPAIRQVVILTLGTGGLLVMPYVRGALVGPAGVADAESASLLAAVRAALPESDREQNDNPEYLDALAAAGVDQRLLDGCAGVYLQELSTGAARLTGRGSAANPSGTELTWLGPADDLAAVCAEALRMIAELPVRHLPPGTPAGTAFGIKKTWLAVRGSTVEQIAAVIGLTGAEPAGWDDGVRATFGGQVFVSPPTGGWIFVVNAVRGFDGTSVASLSARLGAEVQYFGNHRVSDYAEWALAVDGKLLRHVYCSERTEACEETGAPTAIEVELGFSATQPGEMWPDQDDVLRVAAAWSIDPTTLSVIESSPRPGLLGALAC
ncbi:hypothetical protein [Actinoplanes sp. HUAS TT8]|uniref:hypothetical protein n=1 Tax=Actinoplanes sp. HUAS TT8 TaxID=3447453 RepID=UPI003F51FB50